MVTLTCSETPFRGWLRLILTTGHLHQFCLGCLVVMHFVFWEDSVSGDAKNVFVYLFCVCVGFFHLTLPETEVFSSWHHADIGIGPGFLNWEGWWLKTFQKLHSTSNNHTAVAIIQARGKAATGVDYIIYIYIYIPNTITNTGFESSFSLTESSKSAEISSGWIVTFGDLFSLCTLEGLVLISDKDAIRTQMQFCLTCQKYKIRLISNFLLLHS